MGTMHHYHSYRPSPLEIKQLAEFDASLGDLPEAEKKKRLIIYLRDATQQINVGKSLLKKLGFVFIIPFVIIPLFWPFLIFFWFMRKKAGALMDNQLANALDYWSIQKHEIEYKSNQLLHEMPLTHRS